ncbi:DUF3954 domain-containing protein [Rummeliibacillus sp. NPDC094406]|uniref:DUF3954 domain-containing protein n=1 Tax=Rummeliibacillus sp. NPDC094406 TaxID=3364511 RepID=UPI0037FEBC1A
MNKQVDLKAEVSLMENGVYIVSGGKLIPVEQPPAGYGKQEICWQHGKVTHVDYKYSKKI